MNMNTLFAFTTFTSVLWMYPMKSVNFLLEIICWVMWSQGLDIEAHGKWRKLINWWFYIISVNVPLQLFVVAALGSSISFCKHFEHVLKVAWERSAWSFPLFSFIIPKNMKDSFMFSYGVQCFEILMQGMLQSTSLWQYGQDTRSHRKKKKKEENNWWGRGKIKTHWQQVIKLWHPDFFRVQNNEGRALCVSCITKTAVSFWW